MDPEGPLNKDLSLDSCLKIWDWESCVCMYVNMPKFSIYVYEFLKLKTKFNKNLVLGIGTIKLVFPDIWDAPYHIGS